MAKGREPALSIFDSSIICPMIGKHIVNQEMDRNRHFDDELSMSQEKQIEVLMIHVRKLNSTLADCRKKERLTSDANDELKAQNLKLSRKVTTLSRNLEVLKAAAALKSNFENLLEIIFE